MTALYAGRYAELAFYSDGQVARGVSVLVRDAGTLTAATLYSDRLRTTTAANPVVTDSATGMLTFWANAGLYDLSGPGITLSNVPVSGDAGDYVQADSGGLVPYAGLPVGTASGTVAAGDDTRIVHAEQTTNRGVAGGYATLDGSGLIPTSQIPGSGTAVSSVAGRTGAVVLAESDITGLTADLTARELAANRGAVNGYAPLDATQKIPIANLPTGTSSATVAAGNDSRITGAAAAARQILAGPGLSGGGDFTADRTLAVVYGTGGAVQTATTASGETVVVLSAQVTGDLIARLAERADGTRVSGEAPLTISTVAGTSTVTVTTSASHGYGTGDVVTIAGVTGITGVNGTWTITRTSATQFTLTSATGSGTYVSGGAVQRNLGGTGSANEGTWNLLLPDTSRDGMVIRGRLNSTAQLLLIRDYLGSPICGVGSTGGWGVYGDSLFTTPDTSRRAFTANATGGARLASGDAAGGVDVLALGNAATPPTGNPDGTHADGSFTTTAGMVAWVRDGRPRVRTSSGHEDELLTPVNRRTMSVAAPGGDTALILTGTLPPTIAGTNISAFSDDQASGPQVAYTTTAASGVDAGLISGFGAIQRRWLPYFYTRIMTDASAITSTRLWVGLTDSELGGLSANPTTQNVAAFRYDTGLDGTTFWRTVTCDGSAATVTTTTTTIASNTSYELVIEVNSAETAIRFWINGMLVATHSTHLPGTSAALAYIARLRTLAAAARSLRLGRITWSSK